MNKFGKKILFYAIALATPLLINGCSASRRASTVNDLEQKLTTLEVGETVTHPGVYKFVAPDTAKIRDTYVVSADNIAAGNIDKFFENTQLPKESAIGDTRIVGVERKGDGEIMVYRERSAVDKTTGSLRKYVNDDAAYCDTLMMDLVTGRAVLKEAIDSLQNGTVQIDKKQIKKKKEAVTRKALGIGPVTSYAFDKEGNDVWGFGASISYGNFGIEGQYFINAPTSNTVLPTVKQSIGEERLSPTGKIASQEYVTTTSSDDSNRLFSVIGKYSLPINAKKNLFVTGAIGPYFNRVSTTSRDVFDIEFTSTESGDFLGRQPSDKADNVTTTSAVKYGGLTTNAGLTYELSNGNRIGGRVGVNDLSNKESPGVNFTLTYEF